MGPHTYWNNSWNKLDMLVVISSILEASIEQLKSGDNAILEYAPTITKIFRIFRVMRIIKLVRRI